MKANFVKHRKIDERIFIIQAINKYLDLRNLEIESKDQDDVSKITLNCADALAKIFEEFLSFGNFRDEWEYGNFFLNTPGLELIINSLKTKCVYNLGIDDNGLYLSTDLRYNSNLRYMDDTFWKLLLRLSEFDGFIFEQFESVNTERKNEFPDLFKTNKSIVYRIMRKYFFDNTETNYQYRSGCVGELKILSTFDEDFNSSVEKFCETFKIMYKLNYDLWKVSDLKKINS